MCQMIKMGHTCVPCLVGAGVRATAAGTVNVGIQYEKNYDPNKSIVENWQDLDIDGGEVVGAMTAGAIVDASLGTVGAVATTAGATAKTTGIATVVEGGASGFVGARANPIAETV